MNTPIAATRCALITGGAQGIGKGIALRLLADGYAVVLLDCDRAAAGETVAELAAGDRVLCVHADVADEAAVRHAVSTAIATFGRLTALVNNAGIGGPFGTRVEDLTLEQWRRVLDTNLTGAFLCAKHAAPHLRAARGAIVNIASTRALQSQANTEPYSASKGGLVALTHALAISLGPDVRVNCISPGWIDVRGMQPAARRDMTPLRPIDHAQQPVGRVGLPADIAALAAFLLSDEAGFITGQEFIADGGMTKKMIYLE